MIVFYKMSNTTRRKSRENAIILLYQRDLLNKKIDEILSNDTLAGREYDKFTLKLIKGVYGHRKKIESKSLPKRSRFVPLQKFTLHKLQVIYEENKETLRDDYRIKSFSDFVNYCIMKSLPALEKQLKNPTIIYENNFGDF